ncbi:MAG TPA: serine/threonine-protein kinase [Waterburya sp.]|jgi:serine/threonine protein kinase
MSQHFQPTNLDEKPLGGRYKIISKLGIGGFGRTFLAEDLHLPGHPQCVIKQLQPQTSEPETLVMARRLFDTEAEVLYQLGSHDQIPRLLAHFEDNQEFYLAQEFVAGEPLAKELAGSHLWTESQVIDLLQDILQVLAFVHEQNVIHRDLKPANLIRRHCDGKIVLIDFGAVKQVSSQIVNPEAGETNLTISIGTKGYMPNEQLAGTPRFSSDVYAVGMLAIQGLTGVHPKRLGEDPKTSEIHWRDRAPHISPELADILDNMVRYDFRDRYPTAAQALEALQALPNWRPASLTPPELPACQEQESSPNQEMPLPPDETALTELEMGLEATNIRVFTASTVQTSASRNEITASLSDVEPPPHPSETRESKHALPGFIQRRFVKFWPWLAVFAAVGVTVVATKTLLLSSQFASQIINVYSLLTDTSTPEPTQIPTLTPQPPAKPKPEKLLKKAEHLRKVGQYQRALTLYDQVIALKPKLAEAYWGRCYCLNKLQKPSQAIVACNDALDLKPNYPEALWLKGDAYFQQKLEIEALELYEKATKRKPDLAEAWVSYGVALQYVGRSAEAIRALDKAIDLNRNSAEAWTTKGEALWNLGEAVEAIAAVDKALELQPNNPRAIKVRQEAHKELGQ